MTFPTFNITRVAGAAKRVRLWDGSEAYYKPKIYVPDEGWKAEVPCIDYYVHFVFEVPKMKVFNPYVYMCSCGSPAVIVGRKEYEFGSSLEGARFVCQHHLDYGVHLDGSK